jgi:hypothetical protein
MLKSTSDTYSRKCREWRKLWGITSSQEIYLILKSRRECSAKNVEESNIPQIRLNSLLFLLLLDLWLRKEHQLILKIAFRNILQMRWSQISNAVLATRKQYASSATESTTTQKSLL